MGLEFRLIGVLGSILGILGTGEVQGRVLSPKRTAKKITLILQILIYCLEMQGTYRRRWSNIALFDFGFKKLFYGVGCWRNIRDSSHWQRKVILKTKLQRFSIRHT